MEIDRKKELNSIKQLKMTDNSFVAFDMDNTLLINDIGESVFALFQHRYQNELKEKIYSWNQYIKDSKKKATQYFAFTECMRIMNGFSYSILENLTNEIIERGIKNTGNDDYIKISDSKIPIPKRNETMYSIVKYLQSKQIDIYVITASNELSAQIVCEKLFNIPKKFVIGGKLEITEENKLMFNEEALYPYAEGKLKAIKHIHGLKKPIITAGDSLWDFKMLNHTKSNGLILWLGNELNLNKLNELVDNKKIEIIDVNLD